MINDTIAAIATALNPSGIGIIRLSGFEALDILSKVFKPKNQSKEVKTLKSHTIHYGHIKDMDELIDEVLVMIMRGPHTYTGEDTVEINCHGGILPMKKVLSTVIKYGARPAEPGEFTKRAFLNGKLDLSQAEAVMDVIHAKNEYALKSSMSQLKGSVKDQIIDLRNQILYQIAFIESALDDPEHINIDGYGNELLEQVLGIKEKIQCLLKKSDEGKMISEGIKTVILGRPNAGKSSLLNILVGEDKAIVTEIAGTTRDILEENILLDGVSLKMVDTAGIRTTEDVVEKIGVARAKEQATEADLLLYVVDSSNPLDENDDEIMELVKNKNAIILLNKSDLRTVVTLEMMTEKTNKRVISISAKENSGIGDLSNAIKKMFFHGEINFNDELFITNIRHTTALSYAYDSLELVENSIQMNMPEDFFSIDLMNAYEELGTIIGESVGEDLVNEIFSKFCTGK